MTAFGGVVLFSLITAGGFAVASFGMGMLSTEPAKGSGAGFGFVFSGGAVALLVGLLPLIVAGGTCSADVNMTMPSYAASVEQCRGYCTAKEGVRLSGYGTDSKCVCGAVIRPPKAQAKSVPEAAPVTPEAPPVVPAPASVEGGAL